MIATEFEVKLRRPHLAQELFISSLAKRKIVRAGRRSGKTVGVAILAINHFLNGGRVLYGAPTQEQVETFWWEVNRSLASTFDSSRGIFYKNETEHLIELKGTKQRIKAKTCWNANTLRGDYASLLIFDEYQLTDENAWEVVGAPMLLDNNGDAVFIYTPPSLRSTGVSKAKDPRHAAKMFKKAQADKTGRWEAFHFTSHDNPFISKDALGELIQDMSKQSYRQEILAEDDELSWKQLVYGVFKEDVCLIDRMPKISKEWLIYSGHDFGGANPAALFVAQDPATGNFYEFNAYLPGPGRSTAEHVEEFKRITEGYNVIQRVGGSPQEDEIRQGYSAHGWPIQAPKLTKVNAQVDRVIGMMELNKIFIFKDLWQRTDEMFNCLWDIDNMGQITNKIKDEQKYHLCACARYLYSNFVPETVASRDKIEVQVF